MWQWSSCSPQDISEHAASMCLYLNTEHHHPQQRGKQQTGFFRSHRTKTFHNIPASCSRLVLMEIGRWSDCCDNESADPQLRYWDRFRKTGGALASTSYRTLTQTLLMFMTAAFSSPPSWHNNLKISNRDVYCDSVACPIINLSC